MDAYQVWVCGECGEQHDYRRWADECCYVEPPADPTKLPPVLLHEADEAAAIEYRKLMQEAEERGQMRL